MQTKKGITLLVLVITIIVTIILASAGIVTLSKALNNSKKASFAEELSIIEDQVSIYYLQNGEEYPAYVNDEETLISKTPAEIKEIVGDKKFNSLKEEMKLNKENGDSDITVDTPLAFYVIDLDKLDLDKKTRGVKKNDSEEDVYVISAKTNRVYYLKGIKAGGTTYFSLANLMGYTNKVEKTETGEVEVTKVGVLTAKRAKKSWTNTMGVTLSVEDTTGTISATLKDGETTIASSNFTLQSEYEINSLADILGASFSSNDKNTFYNSNNKVIEFKKENDNLKVDLSNYDIISPEISLDSITKNILENENIITFKVRDTQSGIKMVKYDYLKIYDDSGDIQTYYKDTTTLEPSFIKARGKKADISAPDENGYVTVTIKLPYKIEGIQVYIADKAGNYTKDSNEAPITIGVYDFDNDPYIGCDLKSITNSGLTFKAVFNTNDETETNLLTSYNVQVSTDNTIYTGDLSENLTSPTSKYSKLISAYKSNMTIEKKAYVKITAIISGTEYERIFEFDISDADKLKNNVEDGNVLMYLGIGGDKLSKTDININYIKEISFERGTVVEDAYSTFDASAVGDNSIIGYVIKNSSNSYKIIFSSDKTIYPNSYIGKGLFYYFVNLSKITFDNFDTSNVTDMSNMFSSCEDLTELDLSGLDTSNVTDMSNMFSSCDALTELDLSGLDTSNVTNMSNMFYNCSALTKLDLSNLDTSNVTDMSSMFHSCRALTELDLSGLDTSNVTDMSWMFYDCGALTELDLSGLDTSNVIDMSSMFSNCRAKELDLSNLDTSNVTDMSWMFSSCEATRINLSGLDISNVTDMSRMFAFCDELTELDLSNLDTSNVTNMSNMFSSCDALTELDLSSFDTSNVTNMSSMFSSCDALKTIYVSSKFSTKNVTDAEKMFYGCTSLVGGNGTKYSSSFVGKVYARIDTSENKGYFTLKTN